SYRNIITWLYLLQHANPRVFFRYYHLVFSPFVIPLPKSVLAIDPINIQFKTGRVHKRTIKPIIPGFFSTLLLVRLLTKAQRWKGTKYARRLGDKLLEVWGLQIAQLANLNIQTKGIEKLNKLDGKNIVLFNHKSYMDFAIGHLPFFAVSLKDNREFRLRFLAAKDHFIDNFFFKRILGIGKAAEMMGAIFVDRKRKKEGKAKLAIDEAVKKLISEDIDIAIYPQGTRSWKHTGVRGERLDAGYYAVGNVDRLKKEGDHLKKGAAYLATIAAMKMAELGECKINLIPVGIEGIAIVCPKHAIKIQTETSINIVIGDPIVVQSKDVKNIKQDSNRWPGKTKENSKYHQFVDKLHKKIDDSFREILKVHARLERRFFMDIQQFMSLHDQEDVHFAMKQWHKTGDNLIYVILDYIYACSPKHWRGFMGELAHSLMENAKRSEYENLRNKIADYVGK
ncbi:1-acyl-sn-glycerol-3-phosphate acyltransferase, partial [bacterium]|nr:1-acyl-sn-glycerol-3-phosphate acyltransferase [bacterium]